MWTQRDQIQAYQFLRRRMVSALTLGDANAPTSPSRRTVLATVLGVVATVLLLAGFGIFAVIRPGAPSDWRQGGTVIVEKETGARFVIGADGKAHPVLNYTSARLLAGGDGSKTVSVAAKTLATVGRGLPLGIPDAPDSLPVSSSLFTGPWSVCSRVTPGAPASAVPTTVAVLGPLAAGPVLLPATDALVVRDPGGGRYLVTGGTRYALGDDAAVALGLGTAQDVPVSTAFVSAVPVGRKLAVIPVSGAGSPGPRVGTAATLVGQVLKTDNVGAGARFFVVRSDGLAPATELEAALVLGAPQNRVAYGAGTPQPLDVASADALGAPQSRQKLPEPPSADGSNSASAYPAVVPTVRPLTDDLTAGFVVCASSPGQGATAIIAGPTLPLTAGALPVSTPPSKDPRIADAVFVAPGRGLLVAAAAASGSPQGTTYLVTDQGVKYPIGSKESLSALGYGSVRAAGVASSLLALLPTGPALSQAAAEVVAAGSTAAVPTTTASDQPSSTPSGAPSGSPSPAGS
ncbi:type VII secretion protein EccB [Jatrophihabitans sp. YIM 134969]